MAKTGFYNDNRNRCYPFLDGSSGVVSDTLSLRSMPHNWIVDCGFILGPGVEFDPEIHHIYLHSLTRSGDTISFVFAMDAPNMTGYYLTFTRSLSDPDYTVEHLDYLTEMNSQIEDEECWEPLWVGYLVTGLQAELAEIPDNTTLLHAEGDAVVEPALIQSQWRNAVLSFRLANDDRTRITSPEECDELVWQFDIGQTYAVGGCLAGHVRLMPGFNSKIVTRGNSLVLSAQKNAGEGESCAQVPVLANESPPVNRPNATLDGDYPCNTTIRTINGRGGPTLSLLAGLGVHIDPQPASHKITVNFNLRGMSVCYDAGSESDSG